MSDQKDLRWALAGNAVFSALSGLLMLGSPSLVGGWLGIESPLILRAIGAGLLIFATDLLHQATRPRMASWRALYASMGDFLWIIGTFILLVFLPDVFSSAGKAVLLVVAAVVLTFGLLQVRGIRKMHRLPGRSVYRHCVVVAAQAPAEKMWDVIGRLDEIKEYMPSLKNSLLLDGREPGVGAVRMCEDHAGKRWSEECTVFNPGQSFTVRFLADEPGFPFPAKSMVGGWEVLPAEGGSRVKVWWEFEPKPAFLAPIILPVLAFQVDRDFPPLIERMALKAQGRPFDGEGGVEGKKSASPAARLLPDFC